MNRDREIRRVLWLVLVLNLLVAGAKLLYGHLTNSLSMSADGFHSLFDGTSNIIALVGSWFASRPPDESHPYGHRKYETFASFGISVLLFFTCYHVLKDSFHRLALQDAPEVTLLSFGIMLITMGVNFGVMRWERKRGSALKSEVLISDSLHTKSDLYTSASVVISLLAVLLGFPVLDAVSAVFIAGFIGKTGMEILREVSSVLSDSSRIDPRLIREIAMRIPGVRDCHEIRTRGSMNHVYVDFHISVEPGMTTDAAHDLVHHVEDLIKKEAAEVVEVVIHVEPDSDRAEQLIGEKPG
jgi:cation diffusion facilitator family transporter